jgi:hypothetical protein
LEVIRDGLEPVPWGRVATYGVATVLVVLGVLVLAAPDLVPALTIPGDHAMPQMDQMKQMGS